MSNVYGSIVVAARDIARLLKESGKLAFPVPIKNGILPIVEKMRSVDQPKPFKVNLRPKKRKATELHSYILRYTSQAEIFYSSEENLCWRRFAICKELAHLAFDQPYQYTQDYTTIAQEVITETSLSEFSDMLVSERMALYAALELLMPWQLRPELERMKSEKKTDKDIAIFCRVPEKYVNLMLHSRYRDLSTRVNSALDAQGADDWSR